MSTQIAYSKDAREKMLIGINKVADAVRVTLGPNGRNVAIRRKPGEPPTITKDGVTVARSFMRLDDPFEDMGAQIIKEAAIATVAMAGDGTTTATVIAQYLIQQGIKLLDEGANPLYLKKGMEQAAKDYVEELRKISISIDPHNPMLKQIATISCNNDEALGAIVAEAMAAVGVDGLVTMDYSKTYSSYVDISKGLELDKGYIDTAFINVPSRNIAEFEDVLILLYPKKITVVSEIENAILISKKEKKSLLFICDGMDSEAFATVMRNRLGANLPVCVINLPGFGAAQKDILEDIAIATGATVVTPDHGLRLDTIRLEHFGCAKRVVVGRDKTLLHGCQGNSEKIEERAEQIRNFIKNADSSPNEKKILEKRVARLLGMMAIIYVGATTDMERNNIMYLIEDALGATSAALAEGIVSGGGAAGVHISRNLAYCMTPGEGLMKSKDFEKGYVLALESLMIPCTRIIINSGVAYAEIVKSISSSSNCVLGYNAKTEVMEDMIGAGIIDPTKVARVTVENAVSVAGVFLNMDCALADL